VATRPQPVSLREAFGFWLKLGFISFGGPTGQIAIMHQELVERRRWISERRFLHALNYCMVLPGPEAQQLATYIGWLMHRTRGGLVAGGLFVLPSVFILIALSWIYLAYGKLPLVAGIFYGIKPAVTAIVVAAALRIGSRALRHPALWAIAAAAFIAIFLFKVPFPAIVLTAAAVGVLGGRVVPGAFKPGGGHGADATGSGPALIDDDTPPPAHALFSWPGLWACATAGAALWALAMGLLVLAWGWDGTPAQIARFFTKAALVSFGGAYAVLPYVFQGAVEHYGWLTAPQMIDGLALGETTPGPLIMVVAFVGYMAAGTGGALLATYFTFLPSFVFIFMGAPFVETTHGNLKLSAPLTAIAAAVVGVIVNLAAFFAWQVLWPDGSGGRFDWAAALVGAAAFAALFRYKAGIMPVLGVCACAGLAVTLLR
jgi:chromate transporter